MTHIPKGFEDIAVTMQHAHQDILTRLHDYGYAIEDYPHFAAAGNPSGVAAAKAHPMQGILKYHGLADWDWRTAFLPSISVVNDVAYSLTLVEFNPALKEDTLILNGKPAEPREVERVSQSLNAVRNLARIQSHARVISKNVVKGGKAGKGLGTSASGSAALATAAIAAAFGVDVVRNKRFVSTMARLLAGSGCRSASGGVSLWLSYPGIAHEDSFAIRLDQAGQLDDMRLITIPIDSRIGLKTEQAHADAPHSPWFKTWMLHRRHEVFKVLDAVQHRDWRAVAQFAELDSIQLHAVTMTGGGDHKLFAWEPENIALFRACDDLRAEGRPVYFSTDTGPTMVLLTHKNDVAKVAERMRALNADVIESNIGDGAQLIDEDVAREELEVINSQ